MNDDFIFNKSPLSLDGHQMLVDKVTRYEQAIRQDQHPYKAQSLEVLRQRAGCCKPCSV